jgi:hypothetical protein
MSTDLSDLTIFGFWKRLRRQRGRHGVVTFVEKRDGAGFPSAGKSGNIWNNSPPNTREPRANHRVRLSFFEASQILEFVKSHEMAPSSNLLFADLDQGLLHLENLIGGNELSRCLACSGPAPAPVESPVSHICRMLDCASATNCDI